MIPNSQKHREKSKQSQFIHKPKKAEMFCDDGRPEQFGLYNKQRKNYKSKKK